MFKKILLPLDGSELAEKAVPYVEDLASHFGADITLINVRTPMEDPDKPEYRAYISQMAVTIEQDVKKSLALPPGEQIKVKSIIIGTSGGRTQAAEEILDYAKKEKMDLIVMATHGRTGIRRWVLGDTANKVASALNCPVLLIRAVAESPKKVHLNKLMVPLDGSKESEAALPYAASLAEKIKSSINLVTVTELLYRVFASPSAVGYYVGEGLIRVPYNDEEMKPFVATAEKYLKGISGKLSGKGIKTTTEVRVGPPGNEIIEVEEKTHPDMVIMSTHGHSGFGRFDHGSIADKVLHAGNTPLLLVKPPQA
jgi:nucleotide-binding universal stress UspA family protein